MLIIGSFKIGSIDPKQFGIFWDLGIFEIPGGVNLPVGFPFSQIQIKLNQKKNIV